MMPISWSTQSRGSLFSPSFGEPPPPYSPASPPRVQAGPMPSAPPREEIQFLSSEIISTQPTQQELRSPIRESCAACRRAYASCIHGCWQSITKCLGDCAVCTIDCAKSPAVCCEKCMSSERCMNCCQHTAKNVKSCCKHAPALICCFLCCWPCFLYEKCKC